MYLFTELIDFYFCDYKSVSGNKIYFDTLLQAETYYFDTKQSAREFLELKNFKFNYGKTQVLDIENVRIPKNEIIAIIGKNGAGKTTLIKLICGLLHPICGQILIDGVSVSSVNQQDYSKAISAVFQNSALLPVSIKHNIVMNDKKINEDRLDRVVTLVGLEEKIASLEMGLDTPLVKHITENGTEFSGGEVQKLLLARAIYKDSPILILDEPTAAMDPIAEQNVYLKYNELSNDKTAFFTSFFYYRIPILYYILSIILFVVSRNYDI